jgi:PEP-CTERM motif
MSMQLSIAVRSVALGLAAWLCLAVGVASADTLVVPNSLATVEGNSSSPIPFSNTGFTYRFQEVYAASQFGSPPPPAWLIDQIAFRVDQTRVSPYVATLKVRIDLSTTSKQPDGLSTTFASNVGPDDTVVYSGTLVLSTPAYMSGNPVPRPFDAIINLQTPFAYNPSLGNLLLDVHNYTAPTNSLNLDAVDTLGDSISRVYATNMPDGTTATERDTRALVTRFELRAIPEPSSLTLVGIGGFGLVSWLYRRRKPRAS